MSEQPVYLTDELRKCLTGDGQLRLSGRITPGFGIKLSSGSSHEFATLLLDAGFEVGDAISVVVRRKENASS